VLAEGFGSIGSTDGEDVLTLEIDDDDDGVLLEEELDDDDDDDDGAKGAAACKLWKKSPSSIFTDTNAGEPF
jgi:hypothetical protein